MIKYNNIKTFFFFLRWEGEEGWGKEGVMLKR